MALTATEESDDGLFAQTPSGSPGPVLFITNRYNLLQILSAGLITPREAYGKYYTDILELSPGRIPLFRGPLNEELQVLVSADDETAFPVALEVDPTRLSRGRLPARMRGGQTGRAGLQDAEALAWAPTGVIPLSSVTRVLFRSQRELDEHRARHYENIDPAAVRLEVSPEAFSSEAKDGEGIRVWLTELPVHDLSPTLFAFADRLAGARALATAALPVVPAAASAVSRLFPEPGNSSRETSREARAQIADWVTADSLNREGKGSTAGDLNGRLFKAAAQVVRTVDLLEGWRPLEVLAAIEQLVRGRKLAKKDDGDLTRNLESIRGILRNERDFKAFKPGVGLDVAKALFLVLSRPDPMRLLAWSPEESGADAPVMFTAVVLCGLLNGREKLPAELRSTALNVFLSEVAALELSSGEDGIISSEGRSPAPVVVREGADGSSSIIAGDVVLATWKTAPRSTAELLLERDWAQPKEQQIAVELSQMLGWTDCVRTRVTLESGEFSVSNRGKGKALVLELSGWPTLSMTADITLFRERLAINGVPPECDAAVRAKMMATAAPS